MRLLPGILGFGIARGDLQEVRQVLAALLLAERVGQVRDLRTALDRRGEQVAHLRGVIEELREDEGRPIRRLGRERLDRLRAELELREAEIDRLLAVIGRSD